MLNATTVLKRRDRPKGLHRPDGIFLAAGPGIHRGRSADRLSIMDVAPAVLHSLGLPVPDGLDGRLPDRIWHRAPAGPGTAAGLLVTAPAEPDGYTGAEEEDVLARLRGLGYVE